MSEGEWTKEFLLAYRAHRLDDQMAFYNRRAAEYESARREALWLSSGLLVLSALFGALAVADNSRRQLWAVLAAAAGALATATGAYEAAFGFERLARQYEDTRAALHLADVARPGSTAPGAEPDRTELLKYVEEMEGIMRSEVDSWSRLTASIDMDIQRPGSGEHPEPELGAGIGPVPGPAPVVRPPDA